MKAFAVFLIEVIIIAALFFAGVWLDGNMKPAEGSEMIGHPVPLFMFILPIAGALLSLIIDIILIIKRIFGNKDHKD